VEEVKRCGEVLAKDDVLLTGASSLDFLWGAVEERVDDLRGKHRSYYPLCTYSYRRMHIKPSSNSRTLM
jgi:hypothetical protein